MLPSFGMEIKDKEIGQERGSFLKLILSETEFPFFYPFFPSLS